MPFRDLQTYLEDILNSIGAIGVFVADMNQAQYRDDPKTRSAVERQLQILTEAGFRLGEDAERLCPGIPWRDLRDMGNLLRHAYDLVDDERVWNVLEHDLPPLKASAQIALASFDSSGSEDPA